MEPVPILTVGAAETAVGGITTIGVKLIKSVEARMVPAVLKATALIYTLPVIGMELPRL